MNAKSLALVFVQLLAVASAKALSYNFELVGPVDEVGNSWGFDITNSGTVLAKTSFFINEGHSFVVKNGATTYLLPDSQWSSGSVINSHGDVVGRTGDSVSSKSFFWSNGNTSYPPPYQLGQQYILKGLNDAGWMVGGSYRTDGSGTYQAMLWKDGSVIKLGALPSPDETSEATAVNNVGQIVGQSMVTIGPTTRSIGFIWQNGMMNPLATIPDLIATYTPNAISDTGVVAGSIVGGGYGAVMWKDGALHTLPTVRAGGFDSALDVNIHDQIVGFSGSSPDFYSGGATMWQDGKGYDLNTLTNNLDGWVLKDARGINDSGQIVGTAFNPQGHFHAYVLTPVPEPATFLAFGAGLVFLRKRRRA